MVTMRKMGKSSKLILYLGSLAVVAFGAYKGFGLEPLYTPKALLAKEYEPNG